MAENTMISWADHTQNFWLGCDKVSAACDFCYAESWAKRAGMADLWQGRRQQTKTWNAPMKWQRNAAEFRRKFHRRQRVFTNSLADFFDKKILASWRIGAWEVIGVCQDLDWLIVTKRIPNVMDMLPLNWTKDNFGHVILIATVVTQAEYDRDRKRLIALKERFPWMRVGLSMEPLLEEIDMGEPWSVDWVIVGGESGGHARQCDIGWVMEIGGWCATYDVPFHFKQVGNNHAGWIGITGKGDNPREWPAPLRMRQFYREAA